MDSDQIDRDVARCTWHLLSGSQRSRRHQFEKKHRKKVSSILRRKQRRLSNLIKLTLLRSYADVAEQDRLRYYQGYHDVASIFLAALGGGGAPRGRLPSTTDSETIAVALGLDLPSKVLGQVSHSHFCDAMKSSFVQLQAVLRLVLFPLIAAFDPEVHSYLLYCDMEPFFAISWVITWFSHDVRDTEVVKRLFDAFIVSHPLFSLYLSVAMVLHPVNRLQVLTTECDFACVHQTLVSLPSNSCMEGWKYKWGDGFILSDDDEGTVSTDVDGSLVSEDFVVVDSLDEELSETDSFLSVGPISPPARVPFQELIDNAIFLMRRIPPRKLLSLAKRYYTEEAVHPLLMQLPTISLFKNPPAWALASKAKADWVLKQRERERLGLPSRTRKDRRRRVTAPSDKGDIYLHDDQTETDDDIKRYLKEKSRNLAVIASGFGPGDENRSRFRRRVVISIAVAVLAVSLSLFLRYRSKMLTPSSHDVGGRSDAPSLASSCDQGNLNTDTKFAAISTAAVETTKETVIAQLSINPKGEFKSDGVPTGLTGGQSVSGKSLGAGALVSAVSKTAVRGSLGIRSEKSKNGIVFVNSARSASQNAANSGSNRYALTTFTRKSIFSELQWTSLKANSLVLAQTIQRVFERKIYEFIRTTRENILSLEWTGVRERSSEVAHAIQKVAGRKFNELTAKTAVVLHKLELNHNEQKWIGLKQKSREVVQTLFDFTKGIANNVKRVVTAHEADVLDNIN